MCERQQAQNLNPTFSKHRSAHTSVWGCLASKAPKTHYLQLTIPPSPLLLDLSFKKHDALTDGEIPEVSRDLPIISPFSLAPPRRERRTNPSNLHHPIYSCYSFSNPGYPSSII
ncbi:hypothetical protein CDAR_437521 [Caerostris darwini]|uniref:Uncharacterized protein n=1 Tax=Caerostris darwini TaxID=1538125 RepID=A0AAV4NU52_9ARAC|nr:hypothetical protein CDAR_437521 [Caerostris darwini]